MAASAIFPVKLFILLYFWCGVTITSSASLLTATDFVANITPSVTNFRNFGLTFRHLFQTKHKYLFMFSIRQHNICWEDYVALTLMQQVVVTFCHVIFSRSASSAQLDRTHGRTKQWRAKKTSFQHKLHNNNTSGNYKIIISFQNVR